MGVIVFGVGLFLVLLPATWLLEKIGIMEVPAQPLHGFAGSAHRTQNPRTGARGA